MRSDVLDRLIGILLSTYYGGRADVKIRREILRVLLADFVSLYPTLAAIAGLWSHIIGRGFRVCDCTQEFRHALDELGLECWQSVNTWRGFTVIAEVEANDDILPVRAIYQSSSLMRTIGVNGLNGATLWYHGLDIAASKLLTGRSPKIIRALRFIPGEPQQGLRPVRLAGSRATFDPRQDDFFVHLIELRTSAKKEAEVAAKRGDVAKAKKLRAEYLRLDALARVFDDDQKHLKVVANACYGFFVEMNETKPADPVECNVYSYRGKEPTTRWLSKVEEPGPYFHPLVATTITAGTRLMLAILEVLAKREGVLWMACDTDSMMFARPEAMSDDEFVRRVQRIRDWFKPLNPYRNVDALLKLEAVNFKPGTDIIEPLYGLAIAPKSYALFNLDATGKLILREAKQFILENYMPPYLRSKKEERLCRKAMKLRCWQRDLWLRVIQAFLDGHPDDVDLGSLPNFDLPAARRLSISTANVELHLQRYNQGKPYRERIRPGGFLLSFTPKSDIDREYLAYEHHVDRSVRSSLPPREEAKLLYEAACLSEAPWWDALRDNGGRIVPDMYWGRKTRRWKRTLELADVSAHLLQANKTDRSETAEIVYGNTDQIAESVRSRTGNGDLTTSEVLRFFMEHPLPPRLRAFMAEARERTLGWSNELRPLAPFDYDIAKAADRSFNAYGSRKVERWELKTYAELFAEFHRRPEYKYANAEGDDRGVTERRSIAPLRIDIIGKETIRYSRQDHIGGYEPAQFSSVGSVELLRSVVRHYGIGAVARGCNKSRDAIRRILNREQAFATPISDLVGQFISEQTVRAQEDAATLKSARAAVCLEGLRGFARRGDMHPGHITEVLTGGRGLTERVRLRLRRTLST